MKHDEAKEYLGCQLWVEPADSPERVDELVKEAAECGLGWLRIFLMWPWIEAKPGQWDFTVFDEVFDACKKYGIRVKATLTANSGPWHIGTPCLLHSHTGVLDENQWPAMERYVEKCVTRYRNHPALGQWILWNEPCTRREKAREHSDQARRHWQAWLEQAYRGDISALNIRWRTGYQSFSQVQFPHEIPHPAHMGNSWISYGPVMDYDRFSMKWLEWELQQIRDLVRKYDKVTQTCINPTPLLENQASSGLDQEELGKIVDIVGASYHPVSHFTFCDREMFPALMSLGVKKTASHPSVQRVEVTEVQCGNTLSSAARPSDVEPSELARFYLAGIFAGAESVTGWLLNRRSFDCEAGDWGLLDNNNRQSNRSRMIKRVHDVMGTADRLTGGHMPAESDVLVAFDQDAQVVEVPDSERGSNVKGRRIHDGAFGGAVLTARLMQGGVNASQCRLADIPCENSQGKTLFLSHLVAWSRENAQKVLSFAKNGGTVALDATTGRKTPDAALYCPWPGGLAEAIGMTASDLETDYRGYELSLFGEDAGRWLLTRIVPVFSPESPWSAWDGICFKKDGAPCVWERPFGAGKFVLVNGMLGPSALHETQNQAGIKYILKTLTERSLLPVRPAAFEHGAYAMPAICEKGSLTAILSNPRTWRQGKGLQVIAPAGEYIDLWTGETVQVPATGRICLPAEDGIALLWKP